MPCRRALRQTSSSQKPRVPCPNPGSTHVEQGVAGSHQRAAHGMGRTMKLHTAPASPAQKVVSRRGAGRRQTERQTWGHEEKNQWNQQSPRDRRRRRIQRRQPRPDDVSHTEIRGADGGSRNRGYGACGQRKEPSPSDPCARNSCRVANIHDEVFAGVKQLELSQQVNDSAEAHIAEQDLAPGCLVVRQCGSAMPRPTPEREAQDLRPSRAAAA